MDMELPSGNIVSGFTPKWAWQNPDQTRHLDGAQAARPPRAPLQAREAGADDAVAVRPLAQRPRVQGIEQSLGLKRADFSTAVSTFHSRKKHSIVGRNGYPLFIRPSADVK
jgi:hypothetical protein